MVKIWWTGVARAVRQMIQLFGREVSPTVLYTPTLHCEELNIRDTWGGNWKNKTMRCKSDSSKLETK